MDTDADRVGLNTIPGQKGDEQKMLMMTRQHCIQHKAMRKHAWPLCSVCERRGALGAEGERAAADGDIVYIHWQTTITQARHTGHELHLASQEAAQSL